MSYAIHIPPSLMDLMDELPRRTRAAVHMVLAQMAELATRWELGDMRWERFVQRDDEGLRFYVDGCCIRVRFEVEARYLVVREIGRVLVRLHPERAEFGSNLLGSLAEH